MSPSKEEESFNYLSSFPTSKDDFDKVTQNPENSHLDICEVIKKHFHDSDDGQKFSVPCQKITIYLNHLKGIYTSRNISEACKYLNYKINEEVKKLKKSSYNTEQFYINLILKYKEHGYDMNTICPGIVDYLSEDVFAKVKDLSNMYYKINKLRKITGASSAEDCNGVKDSLTLYTSYKNGCANRSTDSFCRALEGFKSYYYLYMGTVLNKCPQLEKTSSSFEITLEGEHGESGLPGGVQADDDEHTPDSDLDSLKAYTLISFLLVLIISFILFILYKFTPFGSWLRPQLRRKKIVWNNIYEEALQLFSNCRNKLLRSKSSLFNIKYHSV
ncbi:Plasmodium vivax Vir protein, putative [Plasmodium ovale]|uniref:Plasmodium vivax Vir protein, putative n=1 Tax=Plasmodium ovale TaxID=36330 RepID=A0A1C3KGE3_PLAOA|nr:Plasmodium vivax Vir protein, putative [Plasmodium ovale]